MPLSEKFDMITRGILPAAIVAWTVVDSTRHDLDKNPNSDRENITLNEEVIGSRTVVDLEALISGAVVSLYLSERSREKNERRLEKNDRDTAENRNEPLIDKREASAIPRPPPDLFPSQETIERILTEALTDTATKEPVDQARYFAVCGDGFDRILVTRQNNKDILIMANSAEYYFSPQGKLIETIPAFCTKVAIRRTLESLTPDNLVGEKEKFPPGKVIGESWRKSGAEPWC